MDDIKLSFDFDDGNLVEGIDKGTNKLGEFEKKLKSISKDSGFDDIRDDVQKFEKGLESSTKKVVTAEKEHKKLTDETKKYSKSLKDTIKDQKVFGISVNDVTAKYGEKKKALSSVVGSLKSGTNALKLFRVALAATGIGVIVIALGSLVALLTKTQQGLDFVSRITAGASAAFDVLIDRGITAGQALLALFSGDFEGAANLAKQAVSGVPDELIRESQAASELERRTQSLRDSRRELNVEYAKTQSQIEDLRNLSRDETKSLAEREAAIKKAVRLETELETKRVAQAKEKLAITKEQNALGTSLADDLEAEAQAEIDLFNIQAETSRKQRRDLQQIQAIRKQAAAEAKAQQEAEQARIKAVNDELEKQIELLQGNVAKIEFEGLNEFEKLAKERELAIAEVEKLRNTILETAEASGKQVDITDDIQILFEAIEKEYRDGFNKLSSLSELESVSINPIDFSSSEQDVILPPIPVPVSADIQIDDTFIDKLQRLKNNVIEQLGISGEDLAVIEEGIKTVFNKITEGILSNTDQQITEQDQLIESLNSKVEATEDALNRELELKKAGYANDFDLLKNQLSEEQAERDAATKKRLELEKKAARQRLQIEAIQQGSALVGSVANILLSSSKFGLAGIITAATGIASLFATFRKFKALAQSQATIPTLRKGLNPYQSRGKGLVIQGPTHENGGVPLVHGNRLYEAEGTEILVGTDASREHHKFLGDLSAGKYKGVNFAELARQSRNRLTGTVTQMESNQAKIIEIRNNRETQAIINGQKLAAMEAAKYIVNGNRQNSNKRQDKYILPDGSILIERYNEKGDLIYQGKLAS